MTDASIAEDPVQLRMMLRSPCVSICEIDDPTGFCRGCWRTPDEIAAWPTMDQGGRLEVLNRLAQRRGAKSLTDPGRGPMPGAADAAS